MIESMARRSPAYRHLNRLIPSAVKRQVIATVNEVRRGRVKRMATPRALVFFVTNTCQLRCPFCFFREGLDRKDDVLTLSEIEQIVPSLRPLTRLTLTGGEPFLRPDLPDIIRLFRTYSATRYVNIPTNGYATERIEEQVRTILKTCRLRSLKIQISLDAWGDAHDCVRGKSGAFDRAMDTLDLLSRLSVREDRLFVEVAANITTVLIDDIERFIENLIPYGVPIKFAIIRNNSTTAPTGLSAREHGELHSSEAGATTPSTAQLESFRGVLSKLNERYDPPFWSRLQQHKYDHSLGILKEGKRRYPCYAGSVEAVLYHNGDVALCEYTAPVGNVRIHGYDFSRVWHSPAAETMRKKTRACSCIHGCNLVTALTYDTDVLLDILS